MFVRVFQMSNKMISTMSQRSSAMSQHKGDEAHIVLRLYDIKRDDLIYVIPWTEQNQTLEFHNSTNIISNSAGIPKTARNPSWVNIWKVTSRRRGLGKVRHLDVADLWAQAKVRTGVVELVKVLGADNPVDIMTKYTDKAILEWMLLKTNTHTLPGRAACAPQARGCKESQ